MEEKRIKSIECISSYENDVTEYKITYEDEVEEIINKSNNTNLSNEIIEEKTFINGYKVVKLSNGEYGFVKEENNKLLPYRYDYATDFNEYGFAMVAKNKVVTWINQSFEYLNKKALFVIEDTNWSIDDGWQTVSNFIKGENSLSSLFESRGKWSKTIYIDTNGDIQKFSIYDLENDGTLLNTRSLFEFQTGTNFDDHGHALANDYYGNSYILFDKGYCMTYNDFIKYCVEKGFMDLIDFKIEQSIEKMSLKKTM